MRTMMIRPFPGAKALITDLGPLIKSRPIELSASGMDCFPSRGPIKIG